MPAGRDLVLAARFQLCLEESTKPPFMEPNPKWYEAAEGAVLCLSACAPPGVGAVFVSVCDSSGCTQAGTVPSQSVIFPRCVPRNPLFLNVAQSSTACGIHCLGTANSCGAEGPDPH